MESRRASPPERTWSNWPEISGLDPNASIGLVVVLLYSLPHLALEWSIVRMANDWNGNRERGRAMNASEPAPERNKYAMEVDPVSQCFISGAGMTPGLGYTFVYEDKQYHFYFFADAKWAGNDYDVDVFHAGRTRFGGNPPLIADQDMPQILSNMRKFFETRRFIGARDLRPPNEVFRDLIFSWRAATRR